MSTPKGKLFVSDDMRKGLLMLTDDDNCGITSFLHSDSSNVRSQPQSFRVRPTNSSVLEGNDITLRCEVNNRVGNVQWAKDGFVNVVTPSGEIVGNPRWRMEGDAAYGIFNLHISNASLSDDGLFECQVGPNGKIKPIRSNAKLTVLCEYLKQVSFLWYSVDS
ncbi:hypothetical protein QAD02_014917 [Eretmocerus hayati]|uniref:Uncharacterized protein n=1 Tax=Eretmocerus hayati TaxID=131215 RepID=A0ACC2P6U1_9HYME|nr:hypothetical protein QAD02_014917 [Eretmocerus hayati]